MVFSHRILGRLAALASKHGFAVVFTSAAALSGCGQKGPLFLPVVPQAPPLKMSPNLLPAPAVSAPASAAR